jgi:YD repeat-containing protein
MPLWGYAPEGTSEWIWGTSASARNIGRLASITGPGYSERYAYDTLGRLQSTVIKYWVENGPAAGRSLNHWLIPQRTTWVRPASAMPGLTFLSHLHSAGCSIHRLGSISGWDSRETGAPHLQEMRLL